MVVIVIVHEVGAAHAALSENCTLMDVMAKGSGQKQVVEEEELWRLTNHTSYTLILLGHIKVNNNTFFSILIYSLISSSSWASWLPYSSFLIMFHLRLLIEDSVLDSYITLRK